VPVKVASAANLSATYNNGSAGVGATLTATANGALSIDGVALAQFDRVLAKDQTDQTQNGVYFVADPGSASAPWIMTRSADFNAPFYMNEGLLIPVTAGNVYASTNWLQVDTVTTIGTDPIAFNQWTAKVTDYLLKGNNLSDVSNKAKSLATLLGFTSTVSAGGNVTLTSASSYFQRVSGTQVESLTLPDSTGLAQGWSYHIANYSTKLVTILNNDASTLTTIPPQTSLIV